jgi:hypothetical protein
VLSSDGMTVKSRLYWRFCVTVLYLTISQRCHFLLSVCTKIFIRNWDSMISRINNQRIDTSISKKTTQDVKEQEASTEETKSG